MMTASERWIIWAAPLAVTTAFALATAPIPIDLTARAFCAAVAFASLMLIAEYRQTGDKGWSYIAGLGARVLIGSALSGAFALLFILAFHPNPSIANVVWMVGIPALVAIGQRRYSLALLVSFIVFGWLAFALVAWSLQVPVD